MVPKLRELVERCWKERYELQESLISNVETIFSATDNITNIDIKK